MDDTTIGAGSPFLPPPIEQGEIGGPTVNASDGSKEIANVGGAILDTMDKTVSSDSNIGGGAQAIPDPEPGNPTLPPAGLYVTSYDKMIKDGDISSMDDPLNNSPTNNSNAEVNKAGIGGNPWLTGNATVAFKVDFEKLVRQLMANKAGESIMQMTGMELFIEMVKFVADQIIDVGKEMEAMCRAAGSAAIASAVTTGVSTGVSAVGMVSNLQKPNIGKTEPAKMFEDGTPDLNNYNQPQLGVDGKPQVQTVPEYVQTFDVESGVWNKAEPNTVPNPTTGADTLRGPLNDRTKITRPAYKDSPACDEGQPAVPAGHVEGDPFPPPPTKQVQVTKQYELTEDGNSVKIPEEDTAKAIETDNQIRAQKFGMFQAGHQSVTSLGSSSAEAYKENVKAEAELTMSIANALKEHGSAVQSSAKGVVDKGGAALDAETSALQKAIEASGNMATARFNAGKSAMRGG